VEYHLGVNVWPGVVIHYNGHLLSRCVQPGNKSAQWGYANRRFQYLGQLLLKVGEVRSKVLNLKDMNIGQRRRDELVHHC